MAGRFWPDEEITQIHQWCAEGVPYDEQGRRLGRSSRSVEMKCVKEGISPYGTRGLINGRRPVPATVRPVAAYAGPSGQTVVEAFAPEESAEETETAFVARMLESADRSLAKASAQRHARLRIATRDPIAISLSSDWHIAAEGTDLRGLIAYADLVAHTPGLYALGVGDLHDNPIKHRGGSVRGVMDELRMLDLLVGRFRGKLLGFTSGNHDDWSKTLAGVDNLRMLAKRHRVHYAPDELLWEVELVDPDDAETVTARYRLHTRHQWRRHSNLNPCHACWTWIDEEAPNWPDWPDVVAIGHHHCSAVEARQFAERDVWAVRMGTWQLDSSYARAIGFRRYRATAPTVVLPPTREAGRVQCFADPDVAITHLRGLRAAA